MSSALRKLSVESLRDTHGRHVNIGVMRVSTDIPTRVVMCRKTLKIHSVWKLKLPLMSTRHYVWDETEKIFHKQQGEKLWKKESVWLSGKIMAIGQ